MLKLQTMPDKSR